MIINKNKIEEEAVLVIDDIAFLQEGMYKDIIGKYCDVKAIDLRNIKYQAQLRIYVKNNKSLELIIINSTFTKGKRKYQMLYFAEKNKKIFII